MGALLNATFGNATEMIISIFALHNGMNTVIKNSLIGSVLGNMMLVLGTAFLVAGNSSFESSVAHLFSTLLLLACMGILCPTVFAMESNRSPESVLAVSHDVALCMCAGYVLYLYFQLRTHKEMFEDSDNDMEEEEPSYSLVVSVGGLAIATLLISLESDILVDSIQPAAEALGLSQAFIGVILVPIVGNAAEHATAILMAHHGRMNIAIGVAVGSSIQIALFVVPFLVLVSWVMGKSLDLCFDPLTAFAMFISVLIVKSVCSDGSSHWLSGAMLLLAYLFVAVILLHA
eukprot:NODE_2660_length_1124_cov_33.842528_g2538_i0.p1 GENE.NODE_2660_length_1124_cov_33.842528_g2538_i0~~NODE_2660_length_1124_cov_33.842528_g2538_i0.p1  ORF type:complete len:327 (+),score=91.68 NODE_2660_length_1124_cov_33.842528_g2538_i0:116-982(+)